MTQTIRPPRAVVTAQDAAITELRSRIARGVLRPGEQVRQEALGLELGLSVVPVREALKTLQAEGQVVYAPHRGYFVAQLNLADLSETYRIRELLEDEAVGRAVPLLADEHVDQLKEDVRDVGRYARTNDVAAMTAASRHFHFTIFEAADMPRLVNFIRILWDSTIPYRALHLSEARHRRLAVREHKALLEAILEKDVDRVTALLRAQREEAVGHLRAILSEPPEADAVSSDRLSMRRGTASAIALPGAAQERQEDRLRELAPPIPGPPIRRNITDRATYRLPSTGALAGQTLTFELEDRSSLVLEIGRDTLQWEERNPRGRTRRGSERHDVVEIRPGIFFADFVETGGQAAWSFVIDREQGRALVVASEVAQDSDGPRLRQTTRTAAISGVSVPYQPIEQTKELIGTRLMCEYGPETAMEHFYLNSRTFLWQRLKTQPELAYEAEREDASMWKVRDRLYLLTSIGRLPMELILLLDLEQMRNVGHLFGRNMFGPLYQPCGAKVTLLSQTSYPPGHEPA